MANIQETDPDSASYENPICPKDSTSLNNQVENAKFTGDQARRPMVPKKGYPERQG
jgi:hypothetical protein